MKQKDTLIFTCTLLITVLALSGCGKKESEQKKALSVSQTSKVNIKKTTKKAVSVPEILSHIDCDAEALSPEQQLWCQGETAWKMSNYANDDKDKIGFIQAYEQGVIDAQQAKDPEDVFDKQVVESGYKKGYASVVKALGFSTYSCAHIKKNVKLSEFYQHWCEGQTLYQQSMLGSDANVILENRFIAGYMSGQAVALTLPASMDSLMQGKSDHSAEAMHAIEPLNKHASLAAKAYHQGFEAGFAAMLAKMKQSVDQVMKQLQQPGKGEN